MTAKEARDLAFDHSKRIQEIYEAVKRSALRGNYETHLNTGECTKDEMEVLRKNGYDVDYAYSEIDGAQYVIVKW